MDVNYTVLIMEPAQHLIDVLIAVTHVDASHVDFILPTWTPGSYLIREYARHVQEVAAHADDQPRAVRKLDKQTWRVHTDGASAITLRYRVYGNDLTVRTNHVDDTHAHVIPAATLMYVQGATRQPLTIEVRAPEGWEVATGLDEQNRVPGTGHQEHGNTGTREHGSMGATGQGVLFPTPNTFVADDYDHLVDSPFEIGIHRTLRFEVDGKPHRIVIWGRGNEDEARLVRDTQRIVETERDFWGGLPYEHYTFFLLLPDKGGGGLEHRNSTSLILPRWQFGSERSYERYLGLVSHEFFHVWNVKRLRAAGLGPFDYTRESYTTLLWAMEGFTEYYTDLLLARGGLLTPKRYLERLADSIVRLQSIPGRQLHSLEQASWDAWIKLYRPDENTINTSVSYYLKGGIMALLLDLDLRRRTGNQRSLDDVLRTLYHEYPITGRGVEPEDYLRTIRELTDHDPADFFRRYVAGTEELPYDEFLSAAGLKTRWGWKDTAADGSPRPSLGIQTRRDNSQLRIAAVLRDGAGYHAGLNVDDEIVAIDGWRVTDDNGLRDRLNERRVGARAALTIARREAIRRIDVELAPAPFDRLEIAPVPDPTDEQQRVYEGWIGKT